MSEDEKNTLIQYILKNQYSLTYDLAKHNETLKENDPKLNEKSVLEWIKEVPELLEQIDSSNLMILASISQNSDPEVIINELINRSLRGESICYGGRVENKLFFRYDINNVSFGRIFKVFPEIRDKVLNEEMFEIKKNPRLARIAHKASNILTIEALYESNRRGYITEQTLDFLESLSEQNPHILDYMDMRLLEPEVFNINKQFISRIARYKDQSTELVTIFKTNPELFKAITHKIDEWENTLSRREATNLEASVLKYASIYAPSMEGFTEDQINNVIEFCLQNKYLGSDMKQGYSPDFKEEYSLAMDRIIEEGDYHENPQKYKYNLPNVYCMKSFGISFNGLKKMYNRKLSSINPETVSDPKLKSFLDRVGEFVSTDFDTTEELEKLIDSYKKGEEEYSILDVVTFEEQVNSMILETYEQGFKETRRKINESVDTEILGYNGLNIRMINMTGNYSMIIRSTDSGFVSDKELSNDSVKEFEDNNPDPSVTIKSCTYINEDFTGIAPLGNNGTYFVYIDNDHNNMGEIGNADIDSNIIDYGVSSNRNISLTEDSLVDNARHVYAEATLLDDRRPDAIALFDDSTDRQRELAMQAAVEYGIDIVFFNKERMVEEQISRLDTLEDKFKETKDLKYLSELISKYETNISGWLLNRDESVEDENEFVGIDNSRFLGLFNEKENEIYKTIEGYCESENSKENIMEIVGILRNEQAKYESVYQGKKLPRTKMKFKAQELIEILNKKYELGLDMDYSEEASKLSSQLDSCEIMPSIVSNALVDGLATRSSISRGKQLLEEKEITKE